MSQDDTGGHSLVILDLSSVNSVRELHERLAETLEFPDCYGKNWDAF